MKIKSIEFENFRNFKGRNLVRFSTDGKVSIIYGNNGDGKTTLHQLFQWAFYNTVHFNKTASDKMYNLQFERELPLGRAFNVWATIEFTHDGCDYLLRREWTYTKELMDAKKIGEDFSVSKKDDDYNWNRLEHPEIVIEQLLPSGLSEYFFFDGESMIADLRVKGHESANKLRSALYSILDLDLLENGIAHIGATNLKTTVLGRLFLNKAFGSSDDAVDRLRAQIEALQDKISQFDNQLKKTEEEKKQKLEFIRNASERIGGTKSKKEYEAQRKQHKLNRENFLSLADKSFEMLGKEIINEYPRLLMAYAVERSGKKIELPQRKRSSVLGLNLSLVESLLKAEICICGQPLTEQHYEHLRSLLKELPYSYETLYSHFIEKTKARKQNYDPSSLRNHIVEILKFKEKASEEDRKIILLDEQEKGTDSALQDLIDERRKAELLISNELEPKISSLKNQINQHNLVLNKRTREFNEATANLSSNKKAEARIQLMNQVKAHLEAKLAEAATEYSRKLCNEVQLLLNRMLTSKRQVSISSDFTMRVFDSYNDESKSEGQFAVVSFAYIGGILKLLKTEPALHSKEYPLVLDGPFSKLGMDHRHRVIVTIPEYAPQIIIFSKDNLQEDFPEEQLGYVWTIQSNEEKNVACIKEGFLW